MLGVKDYREPKEGLEEFWALGLRINSGICRFMD